MFLCKPPFGRLTREQIRGQAPCSVRTLPTVEPAQNKEYPPLKKSVSEGPIF